MNTLQAILLGLVQGLTEYLPVSSSGHLTIISHFFGVDGEGNLDFTVAVHVATVLSTIVILRREIWDILSGLIAKGSGADSKACTKLGPLTLNPAQHYALAVIISMIPVGVVGVCFKDVVEEIFGSGLVIVAISLLMTAFLLTSSHFIAIIKGIARQQTDATDSVPAAPTLLQSFVIGLAQAAAVMPGLSRSGTTIATGMILGVRKAQLAQFSFLMVIPPILGEALLDVVKAMSHSTDVVSASTGLLPLACGFVAAFASGCLACRWMINLVRRGSLLWFAAYCLLVAVVLLVTQ